MTSVASTQNLYGLITKERAEKLDLLSQLILNQRETIILSGAEGVGKTTLLQIFKNARKNIWVVCLFQALETVNLEDIQLQLIASIQQRKPEWGVADSDVLLSLSKLHKQKVVLLIDDAVCLKAEVITALIEYALQHPALRIVLVFTRAQLSAKHISASVLDDGYFIELSALSESQLLVFLQTKFPADSEKISDKLIHKLYQRTLGIPQKIITEFPLLIKSTSQNTWNPAVSFALPVAIVLSAVSFWGYKAIHQTDLPNAQPVAHLVKAKPKLLAKQNISVSVKPVNNNLNSEKTQEKIVPVLVNKQPIEQDADEQWLLQQTTGKYTLQLIALLNRQALVNIAKKYPNLQAELKILQTKNKNQARYVLLYGTFVDTKAAYAAAKSLPAEFRRAWPRKIKSLQDEVNKRTASLLKSNQLPLKQ